MNITDDPDKHTPYTVSIPVTDAAASSDEVAITVDPAQLGSTGLITSPLGPGPRRHTKDKAKVKRRRKLAKASRRRNRR